METTVAYQAGFPGLAEDQVAGNIEDRVRALLEMYPESRGDYQRLYFLYLRNFCGLGEKVRDVEAFWRWFEKVPDYRTVANRGQDLMRANARLQPDAKVMELRQRQRRQGVVK